MPIALIAAIAGKNRVIGRNGDLPWHFASDLKFFKDKTMGHPVVMGRVTYQSILQRLGKPLPGRRNIVLTRDPSFTDARITVAHDVSEAFPTPDDLSYVIGGESLYRATLDRADILYLTRIDKDIDGDAYFPAFEDKAWALAERTTLMENETDLHFCTYRRIT